MEEGSSSVAPEPEAAGVAGVFPLSELLRLGEEGHPGRVGGALVCNEADVQWWALGPWDGATGRPEPCYVGS